MSDKNDVRIDVVGDASDFIGSTKEAARELQGFKDTVSSATKGLAAFIGADALVGAVKAMGEAQMEAQKLTASLAYSTGSATGAAQALGYLREKTRELGVDFATASDAFAKFSAASKGTGISADGVKTVFEGISAASMKLGLSAFETQGALLALSQMASKGVVSAEELRGQLGERLPGAMQIAAKAMGVTQAELGKLMESGQLMASDFLPKFGEALKRDFAGPVSGLVPEINRLHSAWDDWKRSVSDADGGGFQWLTDGINESAAAMRSLGNEAGLTKKLLMAIGGFQFGAAGAGKFDTIEVQAEALAKYRRAAQGIQALESRPINYLEQESLRDLKRQRDEAKAELEGLAVRRGRESFQPPDLAGDYAAQTAKRKDSLAAYLKEVASETDKERTAEENRFKALTLVVGTAGADYEKALAAHKAKIEEINKKDKKAEAPLQKLQFEARAADAGLAPQTLKEIEALNDALKKRNIGYEEYLKLSGVAMANDPLIAKNQKAVADSVKEEARAMALIDQYRRQDKLTEDRIARSAELAAMSERERVAVTAVYKAQDESARRQEQIIKQITDETKSTKALAAEKDQLASHIDKGREASVKAYDEQRTFEYGWNKAFQRYQDDATNSAKTAETAFVSATDAMADAGTKFAMGQKVSVTDMANTFVSQLIRIQMRAAMAPVTNGIGSWLTGLFGVGSAGATPTAGNVPAPAVSTTAFAANGAHFDGSTYAFAKGGTFTNNLYSQPTPFMFANGGRFGVMGEAGPEAVMPLTRDTQGRLGVRSQGGGGQAPSINIVINNTVSDQAEATVKPRMNNGQMELEVIVQQAVTRDQRNNGPMTRGFANTFGLARAV